MSIVILNRLIVFLRQEDVERHYSTLSGENSGSNSRLMETREKRQRLLESRRFSPSHIRRPERITVLTPAMRWMDTFSIHPY
jgi:hypothetical protein